MYCFLVQRKYIVLTLRMYFFKLHFIDYAITVVLIFPFCPHPPSTPTPSVNTLYHCSCPWVMLISSLATSLPVLYATSPWLFSNYLFVVLNPLTSSATPPIPLPSGNYQNALRIHDSLSVLICLFCF